MSPCSGQLALTVRPPSQGREENRLNEQTWKDPDDKAEARGLESTSLQETRASAQILLKENGNRILQVH